MSDSSQVSRRRLRVAIVGWGAIARRVAALLAERGRGEIAFVAVAVRDTAAPRPDLPASARLIAEPGELTGLDIDLVVEAAGRPSVEPWGQAALSAGRDFVVSSTSAFCDDALLARLVASGERTGAQILVPPGAMGG
ncbi:MAG: aspartate dehydrogenase, partial [Nitratireductor sp.]